MTIDVSSLQTFSDTDLLTIYRYALATGGFRKTYSINGRTLEVPDSATCMKLIQWLETRIQDDLNASSSGGSIALARFGDPSGTLSSPSNH